MQKIAVIGNSGGGKTTLSRQLAKNLGLPLTHVDTIQFVRGLKIRPHSESIESLEHIQRESQWIIDGYGPLDILEKRLELADTIIFIDFPIWRHFWWCTKRQIKNIWSPREELPEGCSELSWEHTKKLYKGLWQVHTKMRPEMLKILSRDYLQAKVIYIRGLKEWEQAAHPR
jgi:adenylate kinase family enzyme